MEPLPRERYMKMSKICTVCLHKVMERKLRITAIVSCNIDKLADRRNISRLCLLFKILSGVVLFESPPLEQVCHQYPHRHPNTQQLSVQFAKTSQFQSSFFLSTTSAWNNLNFNMDGISLQTFKSKM